MRRKKIGVMDFHGSVDITDPCYDKDVWCRMNDVKISDGEYTCNVWHHTDKGTYPARKASSLTCAPGRSRVSVLKPRKRFMPCLGRTR